MDACHILLGRPWQYDCDVTHKGRTNEYELLHEGRKVTLRPMSSTAVRSMANSKGRHPGLTIRTSWDPIEGKEEREQKGSLVQFGQQKVPPEEVKSAIRSVKAKNKKTSRNSKRTTRRGHVSRLLKPKGCPMKSHGGITPTSRVTKYKVRERMQDSGKFIPSELRTIPLQGGGDDAKWNPTNSKSKNPRTLEGDLESKGNLEGGHAWKHYRWTSQEGRLDNGKEEDFTKTVHQKRNNPNDRTTECMICGIVKLERGRDGTWAEMKLNVFGSDKGGFWAKLDQGSNWEDYATKGEKPKKGKNYG